MRRSDDSKIHGPPIAGDYHHVPYAFVLTKARRSRVSANATTFELTVDEELGHIEVDLRVASSVVDDCKSSQLV
jgi:hypothetical protein